MHILLRIKQKTRLNNCCPNISMDTIFMNTENSNTNEPHKSALNLSQRLDFRNLRKHVTLQNLCIYYRLKNIRKQYKNNKIKTIAPTWNDKFDLPDGSYSVSNIRDNFEYLIKKLETLITIPPAHVYINTVNNRFVFKIKGGYKLELRTLETITLFDSTKM